MTPARLRERLAAVPCGAAPAHLTRAAVLVALVARDDGPTAIFTRRTDHLADHAGQISFPGGRIEAADQGPVAAALREAEEEIGLAAGAVEVLGQLSVCDTSTGFAVVPVVGLVRPPLSLRADPFEVAEIFEVPLSFLLDPANRRLKRYPGGYESYVFDWRGRVIWGATARIVVDLIRTIGSCVG